MREEKKLFWMENGCFVFMAVTFLFMPVRNTIANRITGILFWISLFGGIFCQLRLSKAVRGNKIQEEKEEKDFRPGIFHVAQNPIALAADMLLAISIPALVVVMIITKQKGYSCFIFIALTAFAFSMHCIWNGRNCEHLFGLRYIYRKKAEKQRRG